MPEAAIPAESQNAHAELKHAQRERTLLAAQILQIKAERNSLRSELERMERLIEVARVKSALVDDLQVEVASLRTELDIERAARAAIEQSRSWRLIQRVRRLLDRVRGRR